MTRRLSCASPTARCLCVSRSLNVLFRVVFRSFNNAIDNRKQTLSPTPWPRPSASLVSPNNPRARGHRGEHPNDDSRRAGILFKSNYDDRERMPRKNPSPRQRRRVSIDLKPARVLASTNAGSPQRRCPVTLARSLSRSLVLQGVLRKHLRNSEALSLHCRAT